MPILCSSEPQETPLRSPERAVSLTRNFGTTKSEMPLVPCGRALDAGEHQMDDVLGEVVLAGRDEDLGAGDRVGAVAIRHGLGLEKPRSVPQWGSVRFMVPVHAPATIFGR